MTAFLKISLCTLTIAVLGGCYSVSDERRTPESSSDEPRADGRALAADTPESIEEPPRKGDESALIEMAKYHRQVAMASKSDLDRYCHTDSSALWHIRESAQAASREWQGSGTTDYARLIRQSCLNALQDVATAAANCQSGSYSASLADQKEWHFREDIQDCNALLANPPPVGARPN
ncbi:hypothetical protein [Stenotrophomonas maltophilia]|uniref:hypothetical protein n=1 Tax=Stenotrophomonas maltophilia TaxID=40324 RepID=UPI0013DB79D6|nr:hypothetical protein [Stenotrophomonas maltophilia]